MVVVSLEVVVSTSLDVVNHDFEHSQNISRVSYVDVKKESAGNVMRP